MVDNIKPLERAPTAAELRRVAETETRLTEQKAIKNIVADSRGENLPFPEQFGEPTSNRHIFRVLTKGGRVFYRCRPYYKGLRRNAGTYATYKEAEAVAADILAGNGYPKDTPQIDRLESEIGRIQADLNKKRAKLAEMKTARRWYVAEQAKPEKGKPSAAPPLPASAILQGVQLRPYKPKRGEKAFKTEFEHITKIVSAAGERFHIHLVFLNVDGGEEFAPTFEDAAYRLQSWRMSQQQARRAKLEAEKAENKHADIC